MARSTDVGFRHPAIPVQHAKFSWSVTAECGTFTQLFCQHRYIAVPDGLALVHSIGGSDTPRRCDRRINKYIFPGGYLPALEQVTAAASQQGLKILDIEIMIGH